MSLCSLLNRRKSSSSAHQHFNLSVCFNGTWARGLNDYKQRLIIKTSDIYDVREGIYSALQLKAHLKSFFLKLKHFLRSKQICMKLSTIPLNKIEFALIGCEFQTRNVGANNSWQWIIDDCNKTNRRVAFITSTSFPSEFIHEIACNNGKEQHTVDCPPHRGFAVWFSSLTTNRWGRISFHPEPFFLSLHPPQRHEMNTKTSWFHYRFFTTFVSCNDFAFLASPFNNRKFDDFRSVSPGKRSSSKRENSEKIFQIAAGMEFNAFHFHSSTIGWKEASASTFLCTKCFSSIQIRARCRNEKKLRWGDGESRLLCRCSAFM